ncbi:hypothetical protein CBR_g2814 [Chara braunii]|uniref:Uncharacterized protein n=1 Tax=Chara braunii TaxID=69332 RepID=A0A388KDY4_CHABU|nr:hypothetical protein CBR_g2814 [Chara braunii]|eukprot:GBG68265.1 hypothetical protein CBR_g2814 [Chara braunii]
MPYAKEDPSVTLPVKKEDGLEISLPRRVKEGEYISSWWGALIGKDIFAWIESGLDDDHGCAIVRVTLYASSSFWVGHGVELALGHGSLLARPLRVAEAAAVKLAKEVSSDGEEQVLTCTEVKRVEEFVLPSAPLRVILPEFLIEKCFGGQSRILAAADAALKTREWGSGCYTCELVYGLYLDLRFSPPSQWLRSMANVVDAYASSHDPDEGVGDWDEIRTAISVMAEESGFAKILRWRNSCQMKVLLCEALRESMPPDLRALLFQGRNLSDFLHDFQGFSLMKKWDERAMRCMFSLFVCGRLSEEVYTVKQESKTWDELVRSLRLRFLEDGIEGPRGECFVPPVADAPSQAELSGLQRQVGVLEERLARLEEARKGKRKVSEDSPSKSAGQGEGGVEKGGQESPLSIGTPKRQASVQARDRGKREDEIKEERGPLKLTKAQRKARNLAQGGQGTEKGQSSQQVAATPQEGEGEPRPRGPPLIEQALHGQWTPGNRMNLWPAHSPYMSSAQSNYMSPWTNMMPCGPPPVQIQPVGPLWPPIQQASQDSMTVGRGRGDGGRGTTG